uniref:Cuticle protein n=2 Tax=Bombyx mori TaxID=7091 RepID=A0A8R2C7D4_BOMMO|nr:uncharacterized protein LOC101743693 isoform X1 [Bombyx mori]
MIFMKLMVLLCYIWCAFASHHSHTIPVEGYETELQDLGQHVEIPETPVKVIKITKTIAVKIPVPYPVKIKERVPYPVHVAKPYPVPVPQIIKVPHIVTPGNGHNSHEASEDGVQNNSYNVQENHEPSDGGQSYRPTSNIHSFEGSPSYSQDAAQFSEEYAGTPSGYNAPTYSNYGNSGNGDNTFEHNQYEQLRDFLPHNQGAAHSDGGNSYYH